MAGLVTSFRYFTADVTDRDVREIRETMQARSRAFAIQRIRRSFMHEMGPLPRLSFWGMAHWRMTRYQCHQVSTAPVPWGWHNWREPDRNIVHVMPIWLWALVVFGSNLAGVHGKGSAVILPLGWRGLLLWMTRPCECGHTEEEHDAARGCQRCDCVIYEKATEEE